MTNAKFIEAALCLGIEYEISYWWHDFDGEIVPSINCNDIFWWGVADYEEVTPENLGELERAMMECNDIESEDFKGIKTVRPITLVYYGEILFCARMRKMRPQGAAYPPKEMWHLIDECGPERKVGIGNPYAPGEYHRKPRRVQRKRKKGWKMPENAVYVGRPGKWGNPYRVGYHLMHEELEVTPELAVAMYRQYLRQYGEELGLDVRELRGKDLACWCPPDQQPCHADVLLELANEKSNV